MSSTFSRWRRASYFACLVAASSSWAGDLNPPAGPVSPTPGPDPRIPLSPDTAPGDATNLFIIDTSGSYKLTRNYDIIGSQTLIKITAPNVTVDMNGFTIKGPDLGQGDGIVVDIPGDNGGATVIKNGNIYDWNNGVRVQNIPDNDAAYVIFENVNSSSNAADGFNIVDPRARFFNVEANFNGGDGIDAAAGTVRISEGRTGNNSGNGIITGPNAQIDQVTANQNNGHGIKVGTTSRVEDCKADENLLDGVNAADGKVDIYRTQANRNSEDGICGGDFMYVTQSRAFNNVGNGIEIISGAATDNETSENTTGTRATGSARITNSTANGNNTIGFDLGPCSTLDKCNAQHNIIGATVGPCSTIKDSMIAENLSSGVETDSTATIKDSNIVFNGSVGIVLGTDTNAVGQAQVIGNRIIGHFFTGVFILSDKNLVAKNFFIDNGSHVTDDGADNKIADILCDPSIAKAWDNWEQ